MFLNLFCYAEPFWQIKTFTEPPLLPKNVLRNPFATFIWILELLCYHESFTVDWNLSTLDVAMSKVWNFFYHKLGNCVPLIKKMNNREQLLFKFGGTPVEKHCSNPLPHFSNSACTFKIECRFFVCSIKTDYFSRLLLFSFCSLKLQGH